MLITPEWSPAMAERLARINAGAHDWHEYNAYVGELAAVCLGAAFLVGVTRWRAPRRDFFVTAVAALFFFLMVLGGFHPYAPYRLVHHLPGFAADHVSGRWFSPLSFVLALLLLHAVRFSRRFSGVRAWRRVSIWMLTTLAALAITADVARHARPVLLGTFHRPERQGHEKQYPEAQKHLYHPVDTGAPGRSSRSMYSALLRNESVLDCYEPQQPTRGADAGPLIAVRSGDAEVEGMILRPNDIAFRVRTRTDSTIQLNQNFVAGWRFSDAAIVVSNEQHRPTVRLPAGYSGEVSFYYLPASVLLGAGLAAVGMILAFLPFVLPRRFSLPAPSGAGG